MFSINTTIFNLGTLLVNFHGKESFYRYEISFESGEPVIDCKPSYICYNWFWSYYLIGSCALPSSSHDFRLIKKF